MRQTAVYVAGETGRTGKSCRTETDDVTRIIEIALADEHQSVRNAVIGALERVGEKNPKSTLYFEKTFLHRQDPMARRAVVHGIEPRGRTYPEEILPLPKEVQSDPYKKSKKNGDPRVGADKLQKRRSGKCCYCSKMVKKLGNGKKSIKIDSKRS